MQIIEKREDGKLILIENYRVRGEHIKQHAMQESLQEFIIEGNKFKCLAAFRFPISRPDEKNLNDRYYNTPLWENVIKMKMGEGSYGLMDHPEGDGSTKDRFCVWHNVHISEDKKLTLADCYLFGRWGQDVLDGLEAGGEVGLSTVGFGEFKEDGCTIDEATYELDRVADFVLHPSYEVYGSLSDNIADASVKENTSNESVKDLKENKEKKDVKPMKQRQTLEERDFRRKITDAVNGIDLLPDLAEKLFQYEEIISYFEGVDYAEDLKEEIHAKYVELIEYKEDLVLKGFSHDALVEKHEILQTQHIALTEDFNGLRETIKGKDKESVVTQSLADDLKLYCSKLKDVVITEKAKQNGMYSGDEYHELFVFSQEQGTILENKNTQVVDLLVQIDTLTEKVTGFESVKEARQTRIIDRKKKITEATEKDINDAKVKEDAEKEYDRTHSMHFNETSQVEKYFNEKIASFPNLNLSSIKDEVLACKTVVEAQIKFSRLKAVLEVSPLEEAYSRETYVVKSKKEEVFPSKKLKESTNTTPSYEGWV